MKLVPKYSYEFNCILNESFNEAENVKNFASLLSDKDRFLQYLPILERNVDFISEKAGFDLPSIVEFYIVRAEKFKSFSEPVTVEYSLLPEEMLLFLFKEIVKIACPERFPDEVIREQYVNSFIEYILMNGDFKGFDFIKFGRNLHDESKLRFAEYEFSEIDFSKKTLREYIEGLYN